MLCCYDSDAEAMYSDSGRKARGSVIMSGIVKSCGVNMGEWDK